MTQQYKMPSLSKSFLDLLRDDISEYQNFIETGTYLGETVLNIEPFFRNLHTIDIENKFYTSAMRKYKGDKIHFHLGDSSKILHTILKNTDEKSIIFLDAHYSGGNTGKGDKDVPLYEELTQIMKHHKKECIVIIDDVRLFGKGPSYKNEQVNWESIHINDIREIVHDRHVNDYFLPSELHPCDRLVIHLSNI